MTLSKSKVWLRCWTKMGLQKALLPMHLSACLKAFMHTQKLSLLHTLNLDTLKHL